jgi:competence ComEA-like helix-hairpin-helix protein
VLFALVMTAAATAMLLAGRVRIDRVDRLDTGLRIDPNTASVDDLQLLPGIGPALAGRIVEHRQSRGAYRRPADLAEVPGLGPKTIDRMMPFLVFDTGSGGRDAISPADPGR